MISSISYNQQEILLGIRKLFLEDKQFECDPTFSKGNFYPTDSQDEIPKYVFDIEPQYDFVKKADCRDLPLENDSINSLIFDPPFLVKTGEGSIIKDRFGEYDSIAALWDMYAQSIEEFSRIIKDSGYLVWKCQNMVMSGKQWWSVKHIIDSCDGVFELVDEFILLARHRMERSGTYTQRHARKFHSYFLVFELKI